MTRRPNPWLIGLALLALGWAQVFGIMRGYLCDCSGVAQISVFDHCHGDHGEACHHDDTPAHSCNDGHDHGDQVPCETHDHEPVKEDVKAQVAANAASTVLTTPPLLFVLPDFEFRQFVVITTLSTNEATAPLRSGVPRSWPQMLTHAVALRI
ncbi:hypothetical protein [Brevifollis gellanilyticus]|uniref:Uncharacterized protein n=1 Tax=Brevifollis gellanilyticus TaxID=748831 RepID=A0A512M449_9BACT|nr:hypothetical protein [Brevifollis gellanilyticus]GEP41488.1 hypothetical protein BGE01nite_07790 [Brevifollis gellanilyticus]